MAARAHCRSRPFVLVGVRGVRQRPIFSIIKCFDRLSFVIFCKNKPISNTAMFKTKKMTIFILAINENHYVPTISIKCQV